MAKAYRPEVMTVPANGQLPFYQSPIRFFRIKNLVGGTSISVQIGENGGFFSEMGIGRQVKCSEPFDFVILKNTTNADITVTFFALDGFEDEDKLLSLDPQTAVQIASTPANPLFVTEHRNQATAGQLTISSTRTPIDSTGTNAKLVVVNTSAEIIYVCSSQLGLPDVSMPIFPAEKFETTVAAIHYLFTLNGVTGRANYRLEKVV